MSTEEQAIVETNEEVEAVAAAVAAAVSAADATVGAVEAEADPIATAAAAAAAASTGADDLVNLAGTTATDAAAAAGAASAAGDEDAPPPKKKRKTKKGAKGAVDNPDDLIDVLDIRAIAKKIPMKKGKGTLHPPWTWRLSVEKVREWRDLTQEQQQAAKNEWKAMGTARQDAFIKEVRVKNQSKTLWLISRGKRHQGTGGSREPPEQIKQAREAYQKVYLRQSKAVKEAEDAKAALNAAQARYEASVSGGDEPVDDIADAERTLQDAELEDPSPWNAMFRKLQAYKEKNGHVRVPSIKLKPGETDPEKLELYKLSAWVLRNRAMYKHFRDPPEDRNGNLKATTIGQITPHRIDALERLGFIWDTKEENWRKMFEELRQFRNDNGHMRVSLGTNASLYRWCDRQRLQYVLLKRGEPSHLSQERLEMLESIGFNWWNTSPQASQLKKQDIANDFDKYYQELLAFKQKNGHTRVAHRKGTGTAEELEGDRVSWRLVQWVTLIRKQYKLWNEGNREECKLDEAKIKLLEDAGFEFTVSGRPQSFGHAPKTKTSSGVAAAGSGGVPEIDEELEAKVAAVAAEAVANASVVNAPDVNMEQVEEQAAV